MLLGFAVSAGAVGLLAMKFELEPFLEALRLASVPRLLLLLGTEAVAISLYAFRGQQLFQRAPRVPWLVLVRARLVTVTANNLLPFRLGEWLRLVYLNRQTGIPFAACLATTALERFFDTVVFFAVFSLCLGRVEQLGVHVSTVVAVGAALGLAAVVGWLAVRWSAQWQARLPSRVAGWVAQGRAALEVLGDGPTRLKVFAANAAYGATGYAAWSIVFWAFNLELPWDTPSVITGFLAFGTAFPAAPAFVGTYHLFVTSALVACGVPGPTALAVATAAHGTTVLAQLLFGAPMLPWLFAANREAPPVP